MAFQLKAAGDTPDRFASEGGADIKPIWHEGRSV
jgi:hypothetical protein